MGLLDFFKPKQEEPNPIKQVDSMIKQIIKRGAAARIDKKEINNIAEFIKVQQITYPFPADLIEFMKKERKSDKLEEILMVYIRNKKNSGSELAKLNKAKGLGVNKVKIRTCQDGRVCSVCKKHANKSYDINKAPKLPLCWDCRCYYEPQI